MDFPRGTINIEQRQWHMDIAEPKTEGSKRTLGVGMLVGWLKAKRDAETRD